MRDVDPQIARRVSLKLHIQSYPLYQHLRVTQGPATLYRRHFFVLPSVGRPDSLKVFQVERCRPRALACPPFSPTRDRATASSVLLVVGSLCTVSPLPTQLHTVQLESSTLPVYCLLSQNVAVHFGPRASHCRSGLLPSISRVLVERRHDHATGGRKP